MGIIRHPTRRIRNMLTIRGIIIGVLAPLDPGQLMKVRYNPRTGARANLPVDSLGDPREKGGEAIQR